jgi:hypothetical protein
VGIETIVLFLAAVFFSISNERSSASLITAQVEALCEFSTSIMISMVTPPKLLNFKFPCMSAVPSIEGTTA